MKAHELIIITLLMSLLICGLMEVFFAEEIHVEFDPAATTPDGYQLEWGSSKQDIGLATGAVIDVSPGDTIRARAYSGTHWSDYSNAVQYITQDVPTLTPTVTKAPTRSPRPTWAQSPTPRPSRSALVTQVRTATCTPTATWSPTPSVTPTDTPTPTPSPIIVEIRKDTRELIIRWER